MFRLIRISWNSRILASLGLEYGDAGISLNGITFTIQGIPRIEFASLIASCAESLMFFRRTYSKVSRRRLGSGRFRHTSSNSGREQILFAEGISVLRCSLVLAFSDMARLTPKSIIS